MKISYALGLALALIGTSATASTILTVRDEQTFAFRSTLIDSNTGASVRNVSASDSASGVRRTPLSVGKFDPKLGTLNSIEVIWFMGAFDISRGGSLTCRDSGIISSACERQSFVRDITVNVATDLPGDATRLVVDDSVRRGSYTVAPGDFGLFTGTGNLSIPWRIGYAHSFSGSCDPNFGTTITKCEGESEYQLEFKSRIAVIYDYDIPGPTPTPVPLPASGLLLLGALAAFRLRRR